MDVDLGKILICLGLLFLTVGLLSLATFGSMTFVACTYAGAFAIVAGFLTKLGLFPERLRSRNAVTVVMLFASTLFFVTGINVLFIDVKAHAQPTRFAFTNANKLCLTLIRPYAFFFLPLMEAGIITLIMAFAITLFNNV
ncbi:MAG: hypothetical protein QXQ61_00750 [Candidatus Bathyarchaeia archaeon]